jgi:lipopolysaccharide transport system ATP-binding protein
MSSSDYVIRFKGLGKQYRLGSQQSGGMYKYKSMRDSLGFVARSPLKCLRNVLLNEPLTRANSFWALKDVSFDVKHGDVIGIIGRNGAGKSTLLKILSRITRPTTGEIELRGRVGSLLEVGTGFHPELSGCENIYLNGAVLGMTRGEVKRKFDEIVAFSEIERFLDTPVKQYSSGMYTRLAFAVAAHLDPEILIVDEVLAVGDAEFQKKCLGKMKDVAGAGRTVLFVSHNMSVINSLCSTVILFENGAARSGLDKGEAISRYLSPAPSIEAHIPPASSRMIQSCRASQLVFPVGAQQVFDVILRPDPSIPLAMDVILEIHDASGTEVVSVASRLLGLLSPARQASTLRFALNSPWLAPGDYSVTVRLVHHKEYDALEHACVFSVADVYPYPGVQSRRDIRNEHFVPDFTCALIDRSDP